MKEKTKIDCVLFALMAALFAYAIASIITFASVLNASPVPFAKCCAGAVLAANLFIAFLLGKKAVKEHNDKLEAIQQNELEEIIKQNK